MLFRLFLLFTLIPMVELYLLIQVGTVIGGINTILLVILTGAAGAWLAKMEGLQTMFKVRNNLQQGLMPAEELLDACIILVAGVVLITPGLMTDVFGLLLLWPVTRNAFKRFMRRKFDEMQKSGNVQFNGSFHYNDRRPHVPDSDDRP
ncbi:MAG: FxsA family protein [Desulfobacterales bacterium]|nr:FxsA family protein [Desulfobacterales bacterium]